MRQDVCPHALLIYSTILAITRRLTLFFWNKDTVYSNLIVVYVDQAGNSWLAKLDVLAELKKLREFTFC